MAMKSGVLFFYKESRRVFWLRHYLNRLIPKLKQSGSIPNFPRLCAFPNDLIGREMAVAGIYEMAGVSTIIKLLLRGVIAHPESSIFIDVGANIGTYSASLAKYFRSVIAFEPHPIANRLLGFNFELNRIANATIYQYALSDCDEKTKLTDALNDNVGASTLNFERDSGPPFNGDVYEVDARRADTLFEVERLESPVALVKIDVEGHEAAVITGMSALILEHQPIIAFEANSGGKSEKVRRLLKEMGYCTFLGLDFYPACKPLWLRVALLTLFGVRYTLTPVDSLVTRNYSLVFAMTEVQKRLFDNQTELK